MRNGDNGVVERPAELIHWRRGGNQVIPRPRHWKLGPSAPWASLPRVDTSSLLDAVPAEGSAPLWSTPESRLSAVLVALFEGEHGAEVLLTRRSWSLSTHRGEVCFPGGRVDPGETVIDAALREATEEVELDPASVTVIGQLDHISTMVSSSLIVPIVGSLKAPPVVRANTGEVDRVFTVPLAELTRPNTYREEHWGAGEEVRSLYFFELDDETIWGATARMLRQLLTLAVG